MKVIVIAAHGWHAGWLGCYGNEWISTPHLDRLASEGVVFDQHYADAPSAAGAIQSWQTGRYFSRPGPDLFQALAEQGVVLVALRDVCDAERRTVVQDWDILIETDEEIDLCSGVETFLEGVDPAYPSLLWVETDQLLPPWIVDPELFEQYQGAPGPNAAEEGPWLDPPAGAFPGDLAAWDRLRHSYAAVVTALDEQVGVIRESLRARGEEDQTILIVTSGWGYPLGEHGTLGPGLSALHEEQVHIPLIARLPGSFPAGARVAAFTQNIDLLPTLLDAFSVGVPASLDGQSLLGLVRGTTRALRPFAYSWMESVEAIRTPEWACLLSRKSAGEPMSQLYRKPNDRWEVNDLRQHHPSWSAYLESALSAVSAQRKSTGAVILSSLRDYESVVEEGSTPAADIAEGMGTTSNG